MANEEHLRILQQGVKAWNEWRDKNPEIKPDLSEVDLSEAKLSEADLIDANLWRANLSKANLSKANLMEAHLFGADLSEANLSKANLSRADLMEANLFRADLSEANLSKANLIDANLSKADLIKADLSRADLIDANLWRANLSGADLSGADLSYASLVETNLENANLTGCHIYGISAWNLKVNEETKQSGLIITEPNEPSVTVDDLEVAQFIYLLLYNKKVRDVIDRITSKVVLILGRFSEERKPILDALRDSLRQWNLTPIIFDFAIPVSRDVTETVRTLAGLAKFVVADITDATEVRAELHNIVPDFPSLPVQPLVLTGTKEFVSLPGHLTKYPWVLPTFEYQDLDHLLTNLDKAVIRPAEAKVEEIRKGEVK